MYQLLFRLVDDVDLPFIFDLTLLVLGKKKKKTSY